MGSNSWNERAVPSKQRLPTATGACISEALSALARRNVFKDTSWRERAAPEDTLGSAGLDQDQGLDWDCEPQRSPAGGLMLVQLAPWLLWNKEPAEEFHHQVSIVR